MHKRVTAFILIAAVLFLAAAEAPLRAQQPPPSPAGPSPAQAAPPAPHQPPSRAAQATERLGEVSFNFDDADIFDVIQTVFGEILKVNYLIDPRVRGRVNFRTVTPVPRSDVLPIMEVLLRLNGAGYLERNGIYEILPLNEIPGTTPKIFVYPLQNSKAAHISTLLQSIFSGATPPPAFRPPSPGAPPGTQPPAPRTGASVIATGTGVLVAPETRVLADEITNSLIILATPNDFNFIEDTIKKLDTVPRQVVIEALIAEVTLTDQLQFGLEWLISNNVSFRTDPMKRSTSLNGVIGQNTADLAAVDLTKGVQGFSYAAVDAAGKVKALLQALASESKLNILASPHIIAADNREARIQIGDQVPIATSQATAVGTSNSILTTIQYKDTGTILRVKPQINESGLVALEVVQEVSNFSTQTVLGTQQFVFSKREATTNLVAQDGQTIVIGGLINNNTNKTQTGIPLLRSLPVIGYLFGSTNNTSTRTEIIVLLTPHVIRNQQEATAVTSDYLGRFKNTESKAKIEELTKGKGQGARPQGEPGKGESPERKK